MSRGRISVSFSISEKAPVSYGGKERDRKVRVLYGGKARVSYGGKLKSKAVKCEFCMAGNLRASRESVSFVWRESTSFVWRERAKRESASFVRYPFCMAGKSEAGKYEFRMAGKYELYPFY